MELRGLHVLVVEDDADTRNNLADILIEEGCVVTVAANGQEALDHVKAELPDVILLDLNMPVLDGWGFREALRRLDQADRAHIVVLTADFQSREKARRLGARACLTKPFDLDDLLDTLGQVAHAC
jgi:two-component system, chemotaxis family, chemotaxis protein CheY